MLANILLKTNGKFILPINDKEIIIIGGIFGGETMIYDKITGNISWQNEVYVKK